MIRLTIILMLLLASVIYSQSSIVYESGTEIEVTSGADICADDVTINGSYSGSGTQCDGPLPVELAYFTGELDGEIVKLNWETATEVNNYGFQVQRKKENVQNENRWKDIGFIQGYGTTNSPKQYSYEDDLNLTLNLNPNPSQLNYRLKQIDNDGTFAYSKVVTVDISTITSIEDEENGINKFSLIKSRPNYIDVFFRIDEKAEEIYQKYLETKNIKDFREKRNKYLEIKSSLNEYMLSIPDKYFSRLNLSKDDVLIPNLTEEACDEYYDNITGFVRDDDGDSFMIL